MADLPHVHSQFLRFAAVGVAGFVVDTAALYVAMHGFGAGPYLARLISYLAAATSTWALNRRYTFGGVADHRLLREWARFLAANAVGGSVNYGVYAGLIHWSDLVLAYPVIGVAAGSIAGLLVNFTLSRRFVFVARGASR